MASCACTQKKAKAPVTRQVTKRKLSTVSRTTAGGRRIVKRPAR